VLSSAIWIGRKAEGRRVGRSRPAIGPGRCEQDLTIRGNKQMTDKPLSAMQRREMYLQDARQYHGTHLPKDTHWSLERSIILRGGTPTPAATQASEPKMSATDRRILNLQKQRGG
jgi:hypothetical protein